MGREKLEGKAERNWRQGCHSNEARQAAKETQDRLLTEVLSSLLLGLIEMKSILPAAWGNKCIQALLLLACIQDKKLHNSCIDHTPSWFPRLQS